MGEGLCSWCRSNVFTDKIIADFLAQRKNHEWCPYHGDRHPVPAVQRAYCTCENDPSSTECSIRSSPQQRQARVDLDDNDADCIFCALHRRAIDTAGTADKDPTNSPTRTADSKAYLRHRGRIDNRSLVTFQIPNSPCWLGISHGTARRSFPFRLYEVSSGSLHNEARLGSSTAKAVDALDAQDWIRERVLSCRAGHRSCQRPPNTVLPSRLLELSGTSRSPRARLIETVPSSSSYNYATLSYCWGGAQSLRTTKQNKAQFMQEINLSLTSKTIRDTIKLVIGIGTTYLWVDAFCIVQDSDDDKAIELSKMADIYTGSMFTLSVASAASSSVGFLYDSEQPAPETTRFTAGQHSFILESYFNAPKPELLKEPLYTRAWTLQESMLSPILVTVFSPGRPVEVRCSTDFNASDGRKIDRVPLLLGYPTKVPEMQKAQGFSTAEVGIRKVWHYIVTRYTRRHMSERTDKLSALAAIASDYEKVGIIGKYIAGLWTDNFQTGLLWTCEVPEGGYRRSKGVQAPRQAESYWIAPSWSWASRAHAVNYRTLDFAKDESAELVDINIVPVSEAVPHGALKSAAITITCGAFSRTVIDGKTEERWGQEDCFDDEPCTIRPGEELWYLELASEEPYNKAHWVGLILRQVVGTQDHQGRNVFKRVGIYTNGSLAYSGSPRKEFTII